MAQESSADAINDAQQAFNRRSANLQLIGTVAGAGTRYGMENMDPPETQTTGLSVPETPYSMNTGANPSGNFYDYAGDY